MALGGMIKKALGSFAGKKIKEKAGNAMKIVLKTVKRVMLKAIIKFMIPIVIIILVIYILLASFIKYIEDNDNLQMGEPVEFWFPIPQEEIKDTYFTDDTKVSLKPYTTKDKIDETVISSPMGPRNRGGNYETITWGEYEALSAEEQKKFARPGKTVQQDQHAGIDVGQSKIKEGYHIISSQNGTVTFAGERNGYGNCIEITSDDTYPEESVTRYAHLQSIDVSKGDSVTQGQTIGIMGNTGASQGRHLHFEILQNGQPVDPLEKLNFEDPWAVGGISGELAGTDQVVKLGNKTIFYSAAFAAQTKTPEQLGLKYQKYTDGRTTNYDACRVCNESTDQMTATGIKLELDRKIVAKWTRTSSFEYGDWVYIPGWGYALVADCGGFGGSNNERHLDCFVGKKGDIIDDGKGNYSALARKCINWKKVWNRPPGTKNTTIYRIKAGDIPKSLFTASANVAGGGSESKGAGTFTNTAGRTFTNYKQMDYGNYTYNATGSRRTNE